jgi:hypothetical protein
MIPSISPSWSSSTSIVAVSRAQLVHEEQVGDLELLEVLSPCVVDGVLEKLGLLVILVSLSGPCVLWNLSENLEWLVILDCGSSFRLVEGLPSSPMVKGGYPAGGGTGAPTGTPVLGRTMIPTPGPTYQIGNTVG